LSPVAELTVTELISPVGCPTVKLQPTRFTLPALSRTTACTRTTPGVNALSGV
jgi:hypothetical protein